MSSLYFVLDELCILKARAPELAAVYTSTAAPTFEEERLPIHFKRF
jgi:hypothetical protein